MASHTPSLSTPAPRSSGHNNATERETAEGKYHLVYMVQEPATAIMDKNESVNQLEGR